MLAKCSAHTQDFVEHIYHWTTHSISLTHPRYLLKTRGPQHAKVSFSNMVLALCTYHILLPLWPLSLYMPFTGYECSYFLFFPSLFSWLPAPTESSYPLWSFLWFLQAKTHLPLVSHPTTSSSIIEKKSIKKQFWPWHVPCGILVPQPGIEPLPPTLEVQGLSHWIAREVPCLS